MSRYGRQLTYYAPDAGEVPGPVAGPRPDALWGYSVKRLDDLAYYAVKGHMQWWPAGDRGDQLTAAWEGITDCLITAAERPAERELVQAGTRAVAAEVRNELRHRGVPHDHTVTAEKFRAYWAWAARATPSPEEGVTDRIAVPQVLAALTPRQREAVQALAAYGDYSRGAAAMGISYKTFHRHLSDARATFRALWHEGETPPGGMWRTDRRADMTRLAEAEICGSPSGYNRHRKRREEARQRCRDANNAYGRASLAARKAAS